MEDSEIKKLSLQYLGIDALDVNFDDNKDNLAIKVNFAYENIVKKALASYRWSFAINTEQLTQKTNLENCKYKYSYILPQNFLRLLNPFEDKYKTYLINDYEIKKELLTNAINPYIEYIARINSLSFPEYFISYLVYKLAAELCYNLTGDNELLNILTLKASSEYISAKNLNMLEQPTKIILDSPFINARF